jgi:hypothetical protein
MIFIDGNHSYEGVSHDTVIAEKILSGGNGVILWHDYESRDCDGVKMFLDDRSISRNIFRVAGTSLCFELVGIDSWNWRRSSKLFVDSADQAT